MDNDANISSQKSPSPRGSNTRRELPRVLAMAVFFVIIFRPVSNNGILVPLFGVLTLLALVGAMTHPVRRIPTGVLLPFCLVIYAGLLWSIFGAAQKNPGWSYGLITFVVGPTLYFLLAAAAKYADLVRFLRWLPYFTVFISFSLLYKTMTESNLIPTVGVLSTVLMAFSEGDLTSNFKDGLIESKFFGIPTVLMLVPANIALLVTEMGKGARRRFVVALAVASSLAAGIVSGRNIFFLSTLLATSLVIYLSLTQLGRRSNVSNGRKKRVFVVLLASAIALISISAIGVSLPKHLQSFSSAISPAENNDVRQEQTRILFNQFLAKPLFGHGIGATVPGYSRSVQRPWTFESQYSMYLFNFGLIGISLLLGAIAIGYRQVRTTLKLDRDPSHAMIVALGMCVAALAMNATNPYLTAIGLQWALFAPLIVVAAIRRSIGSNAHETQIPSDEESLIDDSSHSPGKWPSPSRDEATN